MLNCKSQAVFTEVTVGAVVLRPVQLLVLGYLGRSDEGKSAQQIIGAVDRSSDTVYVALGALKRLTLVRHDRSNRPGSYTLTDFGRDQYNRFIEEGVIGSPEPSVIGGDPSPEPA